MSDRIVSRSTVKISPVRGTRFAIAVTGTCSVTDSFKVFAKEFLTKCKGEEPLDIIALCRHLRELAVEWPGELCLKEDNSSLLICQPNCCTEISVEAAGFLPDTYDDGYCSVYTYQPVLKIKSAIDTVKFACEDCNYLGGTISAYDLVRRKWVVVK